MLLADKEMLKNVKLSARDKGRILGHLFANDEILTLTQVGIVKREIDRPSHNYNADVDSAWTMYNHITLALKESHPSTYMSDHEKVHEYFVDCYSVLVTPKVNIQPAGSDFDIDKQEIEDSVFGVNFL